ncbi:hypothetical protein GCM10025863_32110 [Microbacterium suwonense]|uniref:Uncharacterized protein n=1 Tax=Microbacterium suwonense TaxID=683047 RepID=A0ABM8FXX1_9MICO|nr:hypothetical protein GCM10025863_32110 [Microbacterium suwonense]
MLADVDQQGGAIGGGDRAEHAGEPERPEVHCIGVELRLSEGGDHLLDVLGHRGHEQAVDLLAVVLGSVEVQCGLLHRHGEQVLHLERQRLTDLDGVAQRGAVLADQDAAAGEPHDHLTGGDVGLAPQLGEGECDGVAVEHLGVPCRPGGQRDFARLEEHGSAPGAHLRRTDAVFGDLHRYD